jgi:hypothetical protein
MLVRGTSFVADMDGTLTVPVFDFALMRWGSRATRQPYSTLIHGSTLMGTRPCQAAGGRRVWGPPRRCQQLARSRTAPGVQHHPGDGGRGTAWDKRSMCTRVRAWQLHANVPLQVHSSKQCTLLQPSPCVSSRMPAIPVMTARRSSCHERSAALVCLLAARKGSDRRSVPSTSFTSPHTVARVGIVEAASDAGCC